MENVNGNNFMSNSKAKNRGFTVFIDGDYTGTLIIGEKDTRGKQRIKPEIADYLADEDNMVSMLKNGEITLKPFEDDKVAESAGLAARIAANKQAKEDAAVLAKASELVDEQLIDEVQEPKQEQA